MKKLFVLVAVLFASATLAHAQFGIVGGLNFSNTSFTKENNMWEQAKSVTLFHVGVAYKANLGLGFAIQPALTYEMKGASIKDSKNFGDWTGSLDSKSGFLELGVGLQWGPDLFIGRPFVQLQPYLGYMIAPNGEKSADNIAGIGISSDKFNKELADAKNKFEYGLSIGAGIEIIKHLQLSVSYFMNLGKLFTGDKIDGNEIWNTYKNSFNNINNYNGVKVTLGFFF